MRIGLNLLYLIPDVVGGTETYAVSLIRALAQEFPDDQFVVFLNREASKLTFGENNNILPVVCPVFAKIRFRRYLFEQTIFPKIVKQYNIDVLHSLGYVGPFGAVCPHVVTIHDVNYVRHGRSMSLLRRRVLKYFVERIAHVCEHVITISNASKTDIVRYIGIPEEKISVIYEAASNDIHPLPEDECDNVLRNYGIQSPYIAALSSTSRHKNIARLVNVFSDLSMGINCNLVLIGHLPDGNEIARKIDTPKLRKRIHITGFVTHHELSALLQKALFFIFPSLYEGFGLPLIEAQKLSVPVACSDRGSLPEIAQGSTILFDPESEQEMRLSIITCLSSDALLQELKDQGTINVTRFSWQTAARATMNVYRSLV